MTEKMYIADTFNNPYYLNKRSELALKCRHKAKFLLIPPKTQEEEWALHKLWGGGGEDSACGRPNYQQICRTAS